MEPMKFERSERKYLGFTKHELCLNAQIFSGLGSSMLGSEMLTQSGDTVSKVAGAVFIISGVVNVIKPAVEVRSIIRKEQELDNRGDL